MSDQEGAADQGGHTAGAFDIRVIISVLFFIYGIVLTVLGVFSADAAELAKSNGLNINLWSGIGMVVFAALFALWVKLRPIVIPDSAEQNNE